MARRVARSTAPEGDASMVRILTCALVVSLALVATSLDTRAQSEGPPIKIGYADRSEVETIVRTFEKLMTTDKVDLILPPWGSTANFAVAPLANKNGYPVLAPTALSMKLVDMKLPYFFSMLPQPYVLMAAAADMLAANGIKTVAVIYMDDVFGLENIAAFEP